MSVSFSYTEIDSDTQTDGQRFYHTKSGNYPSITTILGQTADKTAIYKWQKKVGLEEANRIRDESAARGKAVHKLLEDHFAGKEVDYSKSTQEEIQMARTLRLTYESSITKIYGQEVCLYSNELKFAGRCDMVGEWDGQLAIIDFKTSRKLKKQQWIRDYYLQTLAYGLAHDEMFGTNIKLGVVLITVEDELPQCFVVDFVKEAWMYEELGKRIITYHRGMKK